MDGWDFEAAYAVNVSGHVAQKGGMDYLAWSHAVRLMRGADPASRWWLQRQEGGALTVADPSGAWVEMRLVFCGVEHVHMFPVLDHRNKPMTSPDAMAVNKAQMRGLTKLIAMVTGYGLSVYAKETAEPSERPESSADTAAREAAALEEQRKARKGAAMRWLAPACKALGVTYAQLDAYVQSIDAMRPLCQPELAAADERIIHRVLSGLGLTRDEDGRWLHAETTERYGDLKDHSSRLGE